MVYLPFSSRCSVAYFFISSMMLPRMSSGVPANEKHFTRNGGIIPSIFLGEMIGWLCFLVAANSMFALSGARRLARRCFPSAKSTKLFNHGVVFVCAQGATASKPVDNKIEILNRTRAIDGCGSRRVKVEEHWEDNVLYRYGP